MDVRIGAIQSICEIAMVFSISACTFVFRLRIFLSFYQLNAFEYLLVYFEWMISFIAVREGGSKPARVVA